MLIHYVSVEHSAVEFTPEGQLRNPQNPEEIYPWKAPSYSIQASHFLTFKKSVYWRKKKIKFFPRMLLVLACGLRGKYREELLSRGVNLMY